jgi:uncharacterized protein (DUF885 family)
MRSEVDVLADSFLAARIDHDPLDASAYGLPGADDRLPDLSATAQEAQTARYAAIAKAAEALQSRLPPDRPDLDEMDRQTLDFVAISARNFEALTEVPSTEFTVTNFHVAPMSVLLVVLPQLPLDTAARRSGYLARLAAVPEYLDQAARRHLDGVASGRRTVARGVDGAIKQIDEVIADPDLSGIRRTPEADDGAFAETQAAVLGSAVLPALARYREVLANEILPTGRPDERPGICWLPEGSSAYERLIAFNTSSRRTPDELHRLGLDLIAQLDEEYAETGTRLWGMSDPEQIRARLRSDPDLRFAVEDEVVAAAIAAVRRAESEAPKWFGTVPEEQCAVEVIPPALASGAAAAYYMPGAVDGSRRGTYFVNSFQPHERPRYAAESVAFHEAVPGHHFQLTIALEAKDRHLARRVAGDVACSEGWGLYAERLADEMGLYGGDLDRLGMLGNDSWRAARLVVDTGMHALGWSRQAAVEWMLSHVPMSQLECENEIDRYIVYPAQALAYMLGRLEISALRREAADRLGDSFDVRSFHDLVLAVGSVPLPALGAAVRRWVEENAKGAR